MRIILAVLAFTAFNTQAITIPIQDKLVSAGGIPIDYMGVLVLRIAAPNAQPGCYVFDETHIVQPDSEGNFSVVMGSNPNPNSSNDLDEVCAGRSYYLFDNCYNLYYPRPGDQKSLAIEMDGNVLKTVSPIPGCQ